MDGSKILVVPYVKDVSNDIKQIVKKFCRCSVYYP